MGINKVILVGNVGRDPDFRALPSGTHIATFSLATTDMRSKDEEGNPRTEWHNIVAWGKLAEICDRYVTKGRQLYIEGSIRTRTYEKDGQKKYFTEVHANTIELLGRRDDAPGGARDSYGPRDEPYNGGGGGSGFPNDADDVPF